MALFPMRDLHPRRTIGSTMETQIILIALHDESAGYDVSLERVPLATLRNFSADVADLLRGDSTLQELAAVDVAVVQGSLALQTSPLADPGLWADLRSLAYSEALDGLNPRRRKVIERWQAMVRGRRGVHVEIRSAGLPRPVVVSDNSGYRADDADQWVRVERYFRGEIEDLGGAGTPNAHIRLPDGKRLTVENDSRFDEREFARFTDRGAKAWKDVADASAWVESLRGNEA